MEINLDKSQGTVITGYSESSIQINDSIHTQSLLITPERLIHGWPVSSLVSLSLSDLEPYITPETELILIGSNDSKNQLPPFSLISALAERRIGFESMLLGPACRTYSVLNSEQRTFLAGFILTG